MADKNFFHKSASLRLSEIADFTGATIVSSSGNPVDTSLLLTDVAPLDKASLSDISFLDNVKYVDQFKKSNAGACFVRSKYAGQAPERMVLLVTEQPYYAYAITAQRFYPEASFEAVISPSCAIGKDVILGNGVRIDPGAAIGDGARIGDGAWIGANSFIGPHVEIGEHSRIGANCTVTYALLGKRVILHGGVHIGQDGFGFAPSRKGIAKVPQLGRVIIGNDVEIGSCTCVDRGAGPDTVIGDGSKIDNLVQIGHNVHIGKYVFIAAQCGLAGSASIGDGAMIGGQTGISGHTHVGAGAKIAAQSGVMNDVPDGATYGGAPAIPSRDWHRQTIAISHLTRKDKSVVE